uniref:Headcase domain-containing protein n=1 Tax=Anopheles stephensi TaxID=30069 RepID=A0A182XVR8_ANOST
MFILSSLAAQHKSRVACVLCEEPMLVFDRYPLVDGTFFLSPKQHNKGCIEVKYENRVQYLTSVCMACLEGVEPNRVVRCRFCVNKWDGSSLVLGTMYSYDIFAAMPCCTERLKCNNCFKLMLSPNQRLNFYSDYSHSVSCPYCSAQDNHFVKPLAYCYTKQPMHVNGGSLAEASGRQEQQSPFNGSSASCTASTGTVADKAAADSAAMNSFIQELRHLSNSSTISNISSTSNDSGFSTSYGGDSNVGSGRAATNLPSNMQLQQHQQLHGLLAGSSTNVQQHQLNNKAIATGTVSKHDPTVNPALSNIIWGNKSLWGPAPPSPPAVAAAAAAASSLVSPSPASLKPAMVLPSVVTTNPTSNALYTSLSKELYTPWTTSTANHKTPTSMVTAQMQQLPCVPPSQHTEPATLPKTPSICPGNIGTSIWESKLGLVSGPQQALEPLESIWSAPEPVTAGGMNGEMNQGTTAAASSQHVWRSDVPSGTREPYTVGSQFLRVQESMGGGRLCSTATENAIEPTPKLSSLWTHTPWSAGVDGSTANSSNISVLRSLRMGESANLNSGSAIAKDADANIGTVEQHDTPVAGSFMAMASDDVINYLNIFN